MRHFVRPRIKGGRCTALNQNYKSSFSDNVFNIISQEAKIEGNVCENLYKYFESLNEQKMQFENEFDSEIEGHRDINQEDEEKYVNDELSK